jgi:hypothetical protein
MSVIGRLLDGLNNRKAEKFGRDCTKAMLLSALVLKDKFRDIAPSYAWLARRAIATRAYWKQVSENSVRYERTGETFDINDGYSVADAIGVVIEAEMNWMCSAAESWRRSELRMFALAASLEYLRQQGKVAVTDKG